MIKKSVYKELEQRNRVLEQKVSELKRIEKALLDSQEQYSLLVKNLPSIVYKGFKDFTVEFIDNKIELITGYRVDDFNSKRIKWSDLILKEDLEDVRQNFILALKRDKSYVREYRIRAKNGKSLWLQERGQIICNPKGDINYISGVFFDITDRKQAEAEKRELESQLMQAQKMEAIGTLAGGIAHDFNNILQAISGYTQILLIAKKDSDPDYKELAEIEKAAQRARELIRRLLIFGRKVDIELRPVDLNQKIKIISKLLERTIPKMIGIELNLEENLKNINADPIQLQQIIMNIGVNARDAMPDGGKLIFETRNVNLDERYCKTHLGAIPGEYVLLAISDSGHGMEKEVLDHIFEPFFTTKETGKGTGLGMAMVYGIVKSHGGYITCYSEPDQGTTFKIYFPVLKYEESEQVTEQSEDEQIVGGSETILLVDDEEVVLDFGHTVLEQYGYSVIKATSGEDAVEIYRAKKDRIALVILDVLMPGMGGYRCFQELLKINPQIKVIISTGYSVTGKVKETLESGAAGFIEKPYQVRDLLKIVREVIDK